MRVVSTAGHVDHGKSALLRAITGMEPDRWEEERRRGLSIDLGYVWTELGSADGETGTPVAFIDVPGHADYLANMLAGVGAVDHALLVVAADDGWASQSQEHLEILRLLEVEILAVAVTKTDVVDAARVAAVVEDLSGRLAEGGHEEPAFIPVSSVDGDGVDTLRRVLAERLATTDRRPIIPGRPARLWIDRSFRVRGAGSVVTGTLQHADLRVGQDVLVLPSGKVGHIRGLQQLGAAVDLAHAGGRVAVDLGRVPHEDLMRGGVLVGGGSQSRARTTRFIDVHVDALPDSAIGVTGAWHLHLGTGFSAAVVRPIFGEIEPGGSGVIRFELDRELPAWTGDRFILRDSGRNRTAGGGFVLDPHPQPLPRGSEARFVRALALEELGRAGTAEERVAALLDAHGGMRTVRSIEDAIGTPVPVVDGLRRIGDSLVRDERLRMWAEAVLAAAASASPTHAVDLVTLTRAAAEVGCGPELVKAVVDVAVDEGGLVNFGGRVVHRDNVDEYLERRAARQERLLAALDATPLEPPDPDDAVAGAGLPSFEVQAMIDDGRLVTCGPLLFTRSAIDEAVRRLRGGPAVDGAAFSASDARQAWGTTRRCAVPLLEHLRTTGLTVFDGSEHRFRDR